MEVTYVRKRICKDTFRPVCRACVCASFKQLMNSNIRDKHVLSPLTRLRFFFCYAFYARPKDEQEVLCTSSRAREFFLFIYSNFSQPHAQHRFCFILFILVPALFLLLSAPQSQFAQRMFFYCFKTPNAGSGLRLSVLNFCVFKSCLI